MNFFRTDDQLALYFKETIVEPSKASVVFIHGVGEHIERYAETFQAFSGQGYNCFGFDQRGFGQSEGERGHIDAFSDYVEDLEKFIDNIVNQQTIKAIFLLGHSMGSIVALEYALKYPNKIKGLLIFSCPLKLFSFTATLGDVFSFCLSSVIPKLKLPNLIDPQDLSNNLPNIQAFITDPYAFNKISVNWLHEFKLARGNVLNHAQQIRLPVLINHGGADHIAALSGAKDLFAALVDTPDKTLHIYLDLKHELLNHLPAERVKILRDTFEWLKQHS